MAKRENTKEKRTKSNRKQKSTAKRRQSSNNNSSSNRQRNTNAKRSANRKYSEKSAIRARKRLKFKMYSSFALVAILIISVLVAVVISSTNDVTDKPQLFVSENEYVSGIDVSHHNGDIDWETVAENNVDFAIIRAGYRGYTEGKIVEDTNYRENIKGAKKAGIPVGVYFYSQATTVEEAKEEASYVLSLIRGYDVSLPVFIDYEYAFNKDGMHDGRLFNAKLSPSEATDIINAFCDKINKGGHYAGLYASSSVLNNDVKASKLNSNIYIWVADYNKSVKYRGNYDLWQYTKTGKCDGIGSKYTDLNYWYIK